jgi:hypothetical protein
MTLNHNYGCSNEAVTGIAGNVKALLSVAEIEKQKLNYAEKFI